MNGAFLTVLNMSITGSLIIAVLMIVRVFLRKMPRRFSYALWLIPAIRLLCPVSISSIVSVFNLFKPAVTERQMEYIPDTSFNYYIAPNPAPSAPMEPSWTPAVIETPSAAAQNPNSFAIKPLDIALMLWLAVAAGIIIWSVIGYISVWRRVRGSTAMGEYYLCKDIQSPFVFGLIHPRIYLPEGLSAEDVRCILAHEKAHIRRRDYIVKLLTVPILALHWFNPLVWIGIRLLNIDMELSCDEIALTDLSADSKKVYANALLNISMRQNGLTFSGLLGFGESGIKTRIKSVLKMKKPKLWVSIAAIAIIVVASACLLTNALVKTPDSDMDDEVGGYVNYIKAGIPDITFESAGAPDAYAGSLEKALLDQETIGEYTVYLLANNLFTSKQFDPDYVFAKNLIVATVGTDGELHTCPVSSELEHDGVGQGGYWLYPDRIADFMTVYEMEQNGETFPLIVLRNYGEMERAAFMTVISGKPEIIMGDYSEVYGAKRELCADLYNDYIVDSTARTLKDNVTGLTYTFEFIEAWSDGYPAHYDVTGTSVAPVEPAGSDTFYLAPKFGMTFQDPDTSASVGLTAKTVEKLVSDYLKFDAIINCNPQLTFEYDDALAVESESGRKYYPVTGELSTLEEWEEFLNGLFDPVVAEQWINGELIADGGLYHSFDGKIYTTPAGAPNVFSQYNIQATVIGGTIIVDRKYDNNPYGKHRAVSLYVSYDGKNARVYDYAVDDFSTHGYDPTADENQHYRFKYGWQSLEEQGIVRAYSSNQSYTEIIDGKQVTVSFSIPVDWEYNGVNIASRKSDDFKAMEFYYLMPADQVDRSNISCFDPVYTTYPAVTTDSEGGEVTVYEEYFASGLFDYVARIRGIADGGYTEYYDIYRYLITRNGYAIWFTFQIDDKYDQLTTDFILNSVRITEREPTEPLRYGVTSVVFELEYPPFTKYQLTNSEVNEFLDALSTLDLSDYEPEKDTPDGDPVVCLITTPSKTYSLNFLEPLIGYSGELYYVGWHKAFSVANQIVKARMLKVSSSQEPEAPEYIMGAEEIGNILGFEHVVNSEEEIAYRYYLWHYSVHIDGKWTCIAESFGRKDGTFPYLYVIDFDGDGISELVFNCTYGDGGQEVRVFKNNGSAILMGNISSEYLDSLGFKIAGLGSYGERFDPYVGFTVTNYTEEGTRTATFTGLGPFDFVPFVPTEE